MTPTLIFDIETIPDITTGKCIHPELANLSDKGAQSAMIAMRQAEAGSDFMKLPLHKVACLSLLWVDDINIKLKSFSLNEMNEAQILGTFFNIFQKNTGNKLPTLVSWNGSGFDIPVMLYRAMHHKLSAPSFMKEDGDRKYNNYLNRYHSCHIDLMDKMNLHGGYTNRQPLDLVSGICGFAGKQDIDGSMVVDLVNNSNWESLTTYCESDVLNTWLVYLRWQLLCGHINHSILDNLEQATHQYISKLTLNDGTVKHQSFLDAWRNIVV